MSELSSTPTNPWRMRLAIALTIGGLVGYILGVKPGLFGLDLSPVVGFVQIAVMLIGLAVVCLGGNMVMNLLWERRGLGPGGEKSIPADIGFRLISTGYVICVASGMADTFGFGSQPFPSTPYFGQWQAIGIMLGEIVITFGFILMIPPKKLP
jgi:hypothetical protein